MKNHKALRIWKLPPTPLGVMGGIFLVTAGALNLSSEKLTFTTSYPSPAGIYQQLITTGGDPVAPKDTLLVRDGGNVGIGIAAPTAKLHVNGTMNVSGEATLAQALRLGNLAADPPGGAAGKVYFNTASQQFQGFKNGAWEPLGGAPNCVRVTVVSGAGSMLSPPDPNQSESWSTASCLPTQYLMTGGGSCGASILIETNPVPSLTGWKVICYANNWVGNKVALNSTAYAVCCQK